MRNSLKLLGVFTSALFLLAGLGQAESLLPGGKVSKGAIDSTVQAAPKKVESKSKSSSKTDVVELEKRIRDLEKRMFETERDIKRLKDLKK